MDDWKIERRKPGCEMCRREFDSEELHYSGIQETQEGFARQDFCHPCWPKKERELFSYWETRSPVKEERKLESVQGMIEFFMKLTSEALENPMRKKVTYLVSLLLMRRRRIRLISTSNGKLLLEKTWDGEQIIIPDPAIAEEELESLKGEMEHLFATDFNGAHPTPAQ